MPHHVLRHCIAVAASGIEADSGADKQVRHECRGDDFEPPRDKRQALYCNVREGGETGGGGHIQKSFINFPSAFQHLLPYRSCICQFYCTGQMSVRLKNNIYDRKYFDGGHHAVV